MKICQYLLKYLESLQNWLPLTRSSPIFESSRNMLRDILHTASFLDYRPQEIAISIIYFLFICYGIKVPYDNEAPICWFKVGIFALKSL